MVEQAFKKQEGKEQETTDEFNDVFFAFAQNKTDGLNPTSQENVDLAGRLHHYLCTYAFDCSLEVFSSIGYGYIQDPEFKKNIDQFGEGTAQYVCDAIQAYVKCQ